MDRNTLKQQQQDKVDTVINGKELGTMMADLEIESMELAQKIDKCKNKKQKAKLEARLDRVMRTVTTITSGNISLLNH